ncbi:hypothetical protein [Kitasatospora sp. NPDC002040]|uniref:hypothetical protein n=1 Tax=Kitasatospora sp. NPDC002040 TaxID=3154661 RepID=UPI00331680E1
MNPRQQPLTIRQAAEQIAALDHNRRGFGVRATAQARAVLADLDRRGLLGERSFTLVFATFDGDPLRVAQVRQFVNQVLVNRDLLNAG